MKQHNSKHPDGEIQKILLLLENGDEFLKLGSQRDVVVILGNMASSESLFTRYIDDGYFNMESLKAVEIHPGEFTLNIGTMGKIATSNTILELFVNIDTNTTFFLCPTFNKSKRASYEIATVYFMKQIINSAARVKLILSVSYPSVVKDAKNEEFFELVTQLAASIGNITKFKDSFALVVNKDCEREVKKLQDNEIIEDVAMFLEGTKRLVSQKYQSQGKSSAKKAHYGRAIQLIDALLLRNESGFVKIGIFSGSDVVMKVFSYSERHRVDLNKIISDCAEFAEKESEDLSFTLSEETNKKVNMLAKFINERILKRTRLIARDIEQFYRFRLEQTRDIGKSICELQKGYNILSNMSRQISESSGPKKFPKIFVGALKTLGVNIVVDNLIDIIRQCKYLEFLLIIGGRNSTITHTAEWVNPINDIVNYIRDSKDWFTFLVDMHDKLLELGFPSETSLDYRRKVRSADAVKSSEKSVTDILTELESYDIEGYENVTRSGISDLKLRALRNALRTTMKEKTKISCLGGEKISANGTYVKLSEVMSHKCEKKLKSVEIFASDKVLIDVDLVRVGEELQVVILAPKWTTIGQREIKLDGAQGQPHPQRRAEDGLWAGHRGEDGKPGEPGGNSGSYFGISNETIKWKIIIYTRGGRGGPGQSGGNGAEGRRGEDPYHPSSGTPCYISGSDTKFMYRQIRSKKLRWRWNCFCLYDEYEYEFYGWGGGGGNGGNGGKGGLGGTGGSSKHIQLHDGRGSWSEVGRSGESGENGAGGKGGLGGRSSNILRARCRADWYVILTKYRWEEISRYENEWRNINRGKDGIPGLKSAGMTKPPESHGINEPPSSIINRYKDYLISSLENALNKNSLIRFITSLESDPQVRSFYDTLAFVNELQNLESQFHRATDVDLLPFYQSLLQRISQYARNTKPHENSKEYKKVLSYLHAATLSKTRALIGSSERSLITDIYSYLDMTIAHIIKVEKSGTLVAANKMKDEYKERLDEKIKLANDFIVKEVMSEVENIGKETEAAIDMLIMETIEMRKRVGEEERELRKKQKDLENSLEHSIISGIVNFVSGAFNWLSTVGHTAVELTELMNSVSEAMALGDQRSGWTSEQVPQGAGSSTQHQGDTVQNATYESVRALRHPVKNLLQVIGMNPRHLGDMETKIKGIERETYTVGKFDLEKVRKLQVELIQEISRKEEELEAFQYKRVKRDVSKYLGKNLGKFMVLVKVGKGLASIYNKYADNKNAIDEIGNAIKEAEDKIDKLNKYEERIENAFFPMIRAMQNDLLRVQSTLGRQSKAGLHVTTWRVQSTIRDVKLYLRQFTKGFEIQENLTRCIEKLDEAMTTLSGIYDSIQSFTEQKELADYIEDISSANSHSVQIRSGKLREATDILEMTIRSNILLGYYERLTAAFKQWVFPFAGDWLHDFTLPSHDTRNADSGSFLPVITRQIDSLKSKLTEFRTSINKGIHPHIHSAEFRSGYRSVRPFYTWENKRYRTMITDLLAGKEVVVKADALKGVKKNAVKFKIIEINFRALNESIQEKLDVVISHFHVRMTHHGNSYYRCGTKFYVIRSDNQTIKYSREKKDDGEPVDHNSVYKMLKDGNLLLSPYAMWSIRLINVTDVNFPELVQFGRHVDLELVGQGQYVDEDADVCNDELENYYELEDSFSELDRVM